MRKNIQDNILPSDGQGGRSQNRDRTQGRLIPLSRTLIIRLFVLLASLIIGITFIINHYLTRKMQAQFHDQLQEYIVQRGKRESELFSLARDNLIRLKNEFCFQYENSPKTDFTDWFNAHLESQKDGSHKSAKKYFDGVWTQDGRFEHGMSLVLEPEVKITKEIKRRIGVAHDLIFKYGPAWRSRFVNLWFVGPEGVFLNYWPGISPGARITGNFSGRNWILAPHRKKHPDQQILWTGFYFDSLSGQWMISAALPITLNGKPMGTIGTDIECGDFFNRNLSDSAVSSYSIILDQEGFIIVHPYKIAETISSRNPRFTVDMANDPALTFLYEKIREVCVFPAIIENRKNDEVIAVTKIEGPDWYLASVYYKALFKDQITKDVLFSLVLGLGSLMAALFIIFLVVRKNISQPLEVLTHAAEHFNALSGEGDPDPNVRHLEPLNKRSDEFGLLSRTFIQAGTRLKKIYKDLENARLTLEAQVLSRTRDLARAKKAAEAANRDKSRFLANMSHELRTPLNVILGFSRLMERDASLTSEQCENLRLIHKSGDQLLSLINNVLDLSKIESRKTGFCPEIFDLYHFLENMAAMFRQGAAEKSLAFTLEKAPDLPRYILTDKAKLRQVMGNLLGNAINYTEKGSILLKVSRGGPGPEQDKKGNGNLPAGPGAFLRFETRDTGEGIDPEDQKIIFNRFARAGNRRTTADGTGLGLSISRHFLRVMGADLKVESEPGKGSVFYFELPVGIPDPGKIQAPAPDRIPLGLAPGQPPCTVLIAEDHELSLRVLSKLLTAIGFTVHTAENGKAALDIFYRLAPDLVLMDIRMPVMDGFAAVKKIKAGDHGKSVPVIALTAHVFEEERTHMLSAGFDDFMPKPLDEVKLLEKIRRYIGVTYTYASYAPGDTAPLREEPEPTDLARVPLKLKNRLKMAAAELNQAKTLGCIDQIRKSNGPAAETLAALANEFKFDTILGLLDPPKTKRPAK